MPRSVQGLGPCSTGALMCVKGMNEGDGPRVRAGVMTL